MSYGYRSPARPNHELNALSRAILAGETPVNRATADAVHDAVAQDGTIDADEYASLYEIRNGLRDRSHPGQ